MYQGLPFLTIGFPTFNRSDVIEERIEEILSQTFQDFIIVISDNGSTDNTEEICLRLCKRDKRIRYIRHEKNMGFFWNFFYKLIHHLNIMR